MTNITKEQIKKAFVSDPNDIGSEAYNNQDWYQQDAQRMRYILATLELSPGDNYSEKPKQYELGQEDNRFYGCIEFRDNGLYKIKDEKRLLELINMSGEDLADYIYTNEYEWIGDDYDHISQYLFKIMNNWQDVLEYDTEDEDEDSMTITTREIDYVVDSETGFKSENKYEVAYNILNEYWDSLPDDHKESIHKRLEAIGV